VRERIPQVSTSKERRQPSTPYALRLISNGDEIRITTTSGTFHYHVTELSIVGPDDGWVAQSASAPVCTLVTCFPFDYIGPAPRRFIVRGGLAHNLSVTKEQLDSISTPRL